MRAKKSKMIRKAKVIKSAIEEIIETEHFKLFKKSHPEKDNMHIVFDDYMNHFVNVVSNQG